MGRKESNQTKSNNDPRLTLTYFTARSNFILNIQSLFINYEPYITERLLMGCKESNQTNQG